MRTRTAVPALAVLASGTFVLGTGELGVAGLIPAIDADLGVSPATTGMLVSSYAIAVAVAGPTLSVGLARLPRRGVLLGALAAMALGNAATAATTDLPVIFGARALSGAAAAAYVVAALSLATGLVGGVRNGRAVAVVFGGVSVSGIVGVPACAAMGAVIGWRAVFGVLCAATVGVLIAAAWIVPAASPAKRPARVIVVPRRATLSVLAGNGLVTAGHYTVATYLVTLLRQQTGLSAAATGGVLITTGLAGLLGTVAGGTGVDRGDARRITVATATVLAGLLCLTAPSLRAPLPMWLVVVATAGVFSAFSTAAQVAAAQSAGPAAETVGASNISVFNIGIAAGSWAGGQILHHIGGVGVALAGATLVTAGLLTTGLAGRPRNAGHDGPGR